MSLISVGTFTWVPSRQATVNSFSSLCSRVSCGGCLLTKFHFCPDHCSTIRTFSEGKFREGGKGATVEKRRKEDKGKLLMTRNTLATAMSHAKQAPTHHRPLLVEDLKMQLCLIYLLFLLGRLRFLIFQLMLDCTVSNKWTEFCELILVLRLLSTSLSDCTAWHRPGWVSSLWSWEARPGIALGCVCWGGAGQEQNEAEKQPRLNCAICRELQVTMKESHQLWGKEYRTAERMAAL